MGKAQNWDVQNGFLLTQVLRLVHRLIPIYPEQSLRFLGNGLLGKEPSLSQIEAVCGFAVKAYANQNL